MPVIPAFKRVKGVVALLEEWTPDGKRVGSEVVFKPECDWYMEEIRGLLGEKVYTDFEKFVEEAGKEKAKKVLDGEIVEHEIELPETARMVGCPLGEYKWEKRVAPMYYPFKGSKEYLVRERLRPGRIDERLLEALK